MSLLHGLIILGLAVALGGLAAVWQEHARSAISPLRAFAVTAAASIALLHLLPEAVADGGPWVLGAALVGFVGPALLERAFLPGRPHRHGAPAMALAMGYAAVMAHQLGEGAALASLAETSELSVSIVLAVAGHTTPLAMVVGMRAMELRAGRGGERHATVLALFGVLGATVLGAALGSLLAAERLQAMQPWILASIAGLLLHALFHDAFPRPTGGTRGRIAHALAGWLGVALALTGVEPGGWVEDLGSVLRIGAVALMALGVLFWSFLGAEASASEGAHDHAHAHEHGSGEQAPSDEP